MPEDALPWLYAVARRCLANLLRAQRREHAMTAPTMALTPNPTTDTYEQRAGARDVLAALSQLPPKEREALRLCAWEGLSPSAAARVAGCTASTFRVRLHRARRRLAAALDAAPVRGLDTEEEVA